ncbi:hypothetical protein H2200_010920 [Cladophialophora chaetospira]|uniref:Uncharacterized protein n=1 Tax=Cladophialophora chaetospira TaxID=386627 RepID=A0AA39CDX7_9EURO|nr:hypothetical protein H2200_010920 [Cladophialophora chaetospira]
MAMSECERPPGLKEDLVDVGEEVESLMNRMEPKNRLDWRHQAAERKYKQYVKDLSKHPMLEHPDVVALDFKVTFNTNLDGRYDAEGEKWLQVKMVYCVSLIELRRVWSVISKSLCAFDSNRIQDMDFEWRTARGAVADGRIVCANAAAICRRVEMSAQWFETENERLRPITAKLDIIQCCMSVTGLDSVDEKDRTNCDELGKEMDTKNVGTQAACADLRDGMRSREFEIEG